MCVPATPTKRTWCDRTRTTQAPLFPGYVFWRFDPSISHLVVESPGVVRIVGVGRMPLPLEDSEVESAHILARSGLQVEACPFIDGEMVIVTQGPLAGLHGRVVRHKQGHRIVVQIVLLHRAVCAEIDQDWLIPAVRLAGNVPAA